MVVRINRIFAGLLFLIGAVLFGISIMFKFPTEELQYVGLAFVAVSCLPYHTIAHILDDIAEGFHMFIVNFLKYASTIISFLLLILLALSSSNSSLVSSLNYIGFSAGRSAMIIILSGLTAVAIRSVVLTTDNFLSWQFGTDFVNADNDYGFILGFIIFIPLYFFLSNALPLTFLVTIAMINSMLVTGCHHLIYREETFDKVKGVLIFIGVLIFSIMIVVSLPTYDLTNVSFFLGLEYATYFTPFAVLVLVIAFGILGKIRDSLGDDKGFYVVTLLPLIVLILITATILCWGIIQTVLAKILSIVGSIIVIIIMIFMFL